MTLNKILTGLVSTYPLIALATNPWPLPYNLTTMGGSISVATINPSFTFLCDITCATYSFCSSDPQNLISQAFTRYETRMRPPSSSSAAATSSFASSLPSVPITLADGRIAYWWMYRGDDCDGSMYDEGSCSMGPTRDNVTTCQAECEADPNCFGFNTHGIKKNSLCGSPSSIQIGAGCSGCVDLYVLRPYPQPPPGNLTSISVCLQTTNTVLNSKTDESYELYVPNDGTGTLTANTVYGMLKGLETLAQLLDIYNLPSPDTRQISNAPIYITDFPRFSYRGLLIDSARHFQPVEQILHIIDGLAANKMNLLHWHIVDSQAFPCGSNTYPQLAEKGAWNPAAIYSVQDLKTVVTYAQSRGIRILPEWDVPGHGSWGAGIPSIMGCPIVLDPTSDYTYEVLLNFLTEMSTIFIDDWMFLGGDEVDYTCWDANPAIVAWLKAHNMNSSQLQQYFWEQMAIRVLPSLNKTIGVWEADNIQIDLSSLTAGEFVNVYQSLDTANETIVLGNKTTVVSIAGDWWYLDQLGCGSYNQDGWSCVYDVNPDYPNWTPAQRSLLKGGETCLWGEGVTAFNQDSFVWRGTTAAAERLWSPYETTMSATNATSRMVEQLCRLQMLGFRAGPIQPSFCPADVIFTPTNGIYTSDASSSSNHPKVDPFSSSVTSNAVTKLNRALTNAALQVNDATAEVLTTTVTLTREETEALQAALASLPR